MNSPLISGPSFGPSSYVEARERTAPSRLLRIFLFAWLLAGFAYIAVYLAGSKQRPAEAAQPALASTPASNVEDAVRHLDALMEKAAIASASLRRAQDQISRALPGVDRNTLLVEKRRLENALAVTETARRDLEQIRADLEFLHDTLKEGYRHDDHH